MRLGSANRALITLALVAFVAALGYVDHVSGPEIGSALFYLVPILIAAYYLRLPSVIAIVLCSSAAWFVVEYISLPERETWIAAWNGMSSLAIFGLVGFLVVRVRSDQGMKAALNARLRALLHNETQVARTDGLTGLPNSRYFMESLNTQVSRRDSSSRSLCVLYIDLDNFKQVNDQYSHSAGDDVLARFAQLLRATLRAGDLPARLGGDEFAVILDGQDSQAAKAIGERLVAGMAKIGEEYPLAGLGCSVGVAYFEKTPANAQDVLKTADKAMYEVKCRRKSDAAGIRPS